MSFNALATRSHLGPSVRIPVEDRCILAVPVDDWEDRAQFVRIRRVNPDVDNLCKTSAISNPDNLAARLTMLLIGVWVASISCKTCSLLKFTDVYSSIKSAALPASRKRVSARHRICCKRMCAPSIAKRTPLDSRAAEMAETGPRISEYGMLLRDTGANCAMASGRACS